MKYNEKFRIRKKKRRVVNIYLLLTALIAITILITTSYARWSTTLTINGTAIGEYKEPELPTEVTKPEGASEDRISVNTSFVTGIGNLAEPFRVQEDTVEGNVITTKLENYNKRLFSGKLTATFTIALQNNSGYTFTNGNVTCTENDPQNYMTPQGNGTLSATTVQNGEIVTLDAKIQMDAKNKIDVGSYVQYKIEFTVNGQQRYYYYKILIVA